MASTPTGPWSAATSASAWPTAVAAPGPSVAGTVQAISDGTLLPDGTGSRLGTASARSPARRRRRRLVGASDRKSTRLNSSHVRISYAVFCLKKKKKDNLKFYVYADTNQ